MEIQKIEQELYQWIIPNSKQYYSLIRLSTDVGGIHITLSVKECFDS